MKTTLFAIGAIALAGLVSGPASAADLGSYEERETYVERPRVIERERVIVEHHHHYADRYYDEEPEIVYVPRPRVYRYYASGHPYYVAPRFHHYRHHDWRHHGRW
jgi:hypothetical protein